MQAKKLYTSPELEQKLAERAKKRLQAQLDAEWVSIAEFGMMFGWSAVLAVLNDEVSADLMDTLLTAGRKVQKKNMIQNANAVLIGVSSANQKDPSQAFNYSIKEILKELE